MRCQRCYCYSLVPWPEAIGHKNTLTGPVLAAQRSVVFSHQPSLSHSPSSTILPFLKLFRVILVHMVQWILGSSSGKILVENTTTTSAFRVACSLEVVGDWFGCDPLKHTRAHIHIGEPSTHQHLRHEFECDRCLAWRKNDWDLCVRSWRIRVMWVSSVAQNYKLSNRLSTIITSLFQSLLWHSHSIQTKTWTV